MRWCEHGTTKIYKDNREFFKEYQSLRDNLSANELIEIPQLFELIDDVKNLSILDLGCGTLVSMIEN